MRRTQARSNSISGGGKASQRRREGASSLELARLSEGKKAAALLRSLAITMGFAQWHKRGGGYERERRT